MMSIKGIIKAYDIEGIDEVYARDPIEVTDLQEFLGTRGHLLVVRGDLAYQEEVGNLGNPKFWMYGNIVDSQKIKEELKDFPDHKLFDGVGFSALEALSYHANVLGKNAIVVMAHEMVPDTEFSERYPHVEVIHADGPMEEGYVKKQEEVISSRGDLIPLHQALHGAQALAPIGNLIVNRLEEMCIVPDATFWTMASGSNLYGIGGKIKQKFPDTQTIVVEPDTERTIVPTLNLGDEEAVKEFAREKSRHYTLKGWDGTYSGIAPLHIAHPNRYPLLIWKKTGQTGFDRTIGVPRKDVVKTHDLLKEANPDEFDWSLTTALALTPAIEDARLGKNVLVMAYGKYREHTLRRLNLNGERK